MSPYVLGGLEPGKAKEWGGSLVPSKGGEKISTSHKLVELMQHDTSKSNDNRTDSYHSRGQKMRFTSEKEVTEPGLPLVQRQPSHHSAEKTNTHWSDTFGYTVSKQCPTVH